MHANTHEHAHTSAGTHTNKIQKKTWGHLSASVDYLYEPFMLHLLNTMMCSPFILVLWSFAITQCSASLPGKAKAGIRILRFVMIWDWLMVTEWKGLITCRWVHYLVRNPPKRCTEDSPSLFSSFLRRGIWRKISRSHNQNAFWKSLSIRLQNIPAVKSLSMSCEQYRALHKMMLL